MIKIELVKFEAQDIITASTAACTHDDYTATPIDTNMGPATKYECNDCGYSEIWLNQEPEV